MLFKDWVFWGSYDFYQNKLRTLVANELPPEKWSYAGKTDFGILRNYLVFTFQKLWQEREEAPDVDKQQFIYMGENDACFNTGLFDKTWQAIYYYCVKNPKDGYQPWSFKAFLNSYTIGFTSIPSEVVSGLRRANYFADPSALVFDIKLDIVPQWSHILNDEENFLRIPEQIRTLGREVCQNLIDGAIRKVKKRIEANYKTIVPQFYNGKIQLLAPLYLTNEETADLALVLSLSDDKKTYYGHTCLTTEMAYNNARLIARPDSQWLKP